MTHSEIALYLAGAERLHEVEVLNVTTEQRERNIAIVKACGWFGAFAAGILFHSELADAIQKAKDEVPVISELPLVSTYLNEHSLDVGIVLSLPMGTIGLASGVLSHKQVNASKRFSTNLAHSAATISQEYDLPIPAWATYSVQHNDSSET